MAVRHTSNRNSDGNQMGQDPQDKIAFHGATPIVRQKLAAAPTATEISTVLRNLGLVELP